MGEGQRTREGRYGFFKHGKLRKMDRGQCSSLLFVRASSYDHLQQCAVIHSLLVLSSSASFKEHLQQCDMFQSLMSSTASSCDHLQLCVVFCRAYCLHLQVRKIIYNIV